MMLGKIADGLARLLMPACAPLLKRASVFEALQARGVHVVPNHFYGPVPDTRKIEQTRYSTASEMVGVDMRLDAQTALLRELSGEFGREFEAMLAGAADRQGAFTFDNVMFGPIDAEVLYWLVRRHKPSRIIEIGCGHSTRLSASAIRANASAGRSCELTCIEPYPSPALRAGLQGVTRLIEEPVERVAISEFQGLGENDVLFIDSSHALKIGGDVQWEFLELLPRVGVGALVHVHDVFFPFDYPEVWVKQERRFWTEQYLLQAFLMFNSCFEVIWCSSAMRHARPSELRTHVPSWERELNRTGGQWNMGSASVAGTSLWMRRVR